MATPIEMLVNSHLTVRSYQDQIVKKSSYAAPNPESPSKGLTINQLREHELSDQFRSILSVEHLIPFRPLSCDPIWLGGALVHKEAKRLAVDGLTIEIPMGITGRFFQPETLKNLPAEATAHFIYFPTGGYKLDAKDTRSNTRRGWTDPKPPRLRRHNPCKTDSVGSPGFNERLSQRRANAVFEALVYDHKVSESRIQMCWTGERLPFTSTADQTAEAQNRMAAIVVSKAADAHFCGG